MKSRAADLEGSFRSSPMNWTRCPYVLAAAASRGPSSRHGPHHDPHTLRTTGVPRSCDRSRSRLAKVTSGRARAFVGSNGARAAFTAGVERPAPAQPDDAVHAVATAAR